ncbi:metal-sensitive transcriptional regulator [Saliterribacillus persicus]|uniref:DNA-binding FrmR family transcriptional regulator n=1 Tax=Saliterribacillus persicus TaxID=930114 RepID=A0A368XVK3_9BACI|nr:metal-sensitive transcriptional regulator [Saliterribacillus persicus]RCW71982.1 DNA-binding FrmR family transcriptional regulator [Saliterribacillus persicus]
MKYNTAVTNRIKRMDGQVRGVLKMMEQEKDCKDVITQLSAIRTAVDRTIGVIVSSNLVHSVEESQLIDELQAEILINEAVNLLVKSR